MRYDPEADVLLTRELVEVLEEWLILKLRDGDPVPVVGGVEIKVSQVGAD